MRWFVQVGLSLDIWIFKHSPVKTLLQFSHLSQFLIPLYLFTPWLIGVGCYLIGSLVPCVLCRTLFNRVRNRNWKRVQKQKERERLGGQKGCSSIFKQRWDLSQHGSVFHPCNCATQPEREGDGKPSRQLFECRIGVDIGIALFRPAAGRGRRRGGGLGNATPAWTGGKTRTWRLLSLPEHIWIFTVSGKRAHGCLVHQRRVVTAAQPSNGRHFVKACVHFIKPKFTLRRLGASSVIAMLFSEDKNQGGGVDFCTFFLEVLESFFMDWSLSVIDFKKTVMRKKNLSFSLN